jgi:Tfp pilus assembly protein PilN
MQPLNLAKTKILERKYCRRCLNGRVRSAIVSLILAGAVTSWAASYRAPINAAKAEIALQMKDVQADCQVLRNQIGRDENIVGRSTWQNELARGTEHRAEILKAVLCSVPSDTWINSVGDFDKSATININGISPSFGSLYKFTCALRQFSLIQDVQLGSTSIISRESGKSIGFSVKLQTDAKSAARTETGQSTKIIIQVPKIGVSP